MTHPTAARLATGDAAPDLVLGGPDGAGVRLSTLWEGGSAVLVFLRHFGWLFCRRTLARVAGSKDDIARGGGRIAAVTMGTPEETAQFCAERAPGILCLSDPQQRAYRAYGLGSVGPGEVISPGVFFGGVQSVLEGHVQGMTVGDPLQMPGTFVIGRDGRVRLAHYSRTIADMPDIGALLRALI